MLLKVVRNADIDRGLRDDTIEDVSGCSKEKTRDDHLKLFYIFPYLRILFIFFRPSMPYEDLYPTCPKNALTNSVT